MSAIRCSWCSRRTRSTSPARPSSRYAPAPLSPPTISGATLAHQIDDFRFFGELTPDGFAQFPEAYQATTGSRQEPKYDLHAPDLYIPTMAFTTYIILNAFALGTYGE